MKLSYVSVSNYRSITDAYKIDLSNLTVLIGKNNEGKTNIIRAIKLGMEIIKGMTLTTRRRMVSKHIYDWHEDYPISNQNSKKIKDKKTTIRLDFNLSENETDEFFQEVHSNINGSLSIYIAIGEDNSLSITVPKRGKNASSISDKIKIISKFICDRFDVQYIPAVRSENDAYSAITDLVEMELSSIEDEKYKNSIEYIDKIQQERLNELAAKVKDPLKSFLPQVKHLNISMANRFQRLNYMARRAINVEIDDGVLTNLSNKGDGVKSLTTIAMLSQVFSHKDRLIIVDEPENHLHPDAVRYINGVLCDLAKKNQILISTHNPIFVNRNNIASNIIIDAGKTEKAQSIDKIRETLGIICSDNLMYSDYIVIVEGPTDRTLLGKFLSEDRVLERCMNNHDITIRSIGGTNNLKSELYSIQRYCCNYIILLDYDEAGKAVANDIKQSFAVPNEKIRFFTHSKRGESELEDLYNPNLYSEYLQNQGIDISNGKFKNKSRKWSERLSDVLAEEGIILSKDMEDQYKTDISNLLKKPVSDSLTDWGNDLLLSVSEKIKSDLKEMNLIK
ncbi:AAA family ATPase [Ruminococcus sp.]|jgi:putative ATP-dependent endonuclease of OLD family|uniref:ATP-dependent nuclease n=1 Tax=Ruminococcus sp. TaxID=41978 RepID=UPI0026E11162